MPETSRWLSSLIAGHVAEEAQEVELALLGQRRAQLASESERSESELAGGRVVGRSRVVSRTRCSMSRRNCSILAAAATALARSSRTIARCVSWYAK